MAKEKKEALHPNLSTYREYGLVCLKEMYFYDERTRVLSNFAHQGLCRVHPYLKNWPLVCFQRNLRAALMGTKFKARLLSQVLCPSAPCGKTHYMLNLGCLI